MWLPAVHVVAMATPDTRPHSTLAVQYHGKRVKLAAVDGNHIDAMFVDQRGNQSSRNGQKLVCCVWYIHTYIHMYVRMYLYAIPV